VSSPTGCREAFETNHATTQCETNNFQLEQQPVEFRQFLLPCSGQVPSGDVDAGARITEIAGAHVFKMGCQAYRPSGVATQAVIVPYAGPLAARLGSAAYSGHTRRHRMRHDRSRFRKAQELRHAVRWPRTSRSIEAYLVPA
jgi:hypothetical protein